MSKNLFKLPSEGFTIKVFSATFFAFFLLNKENGIRTMGKLSYPQGEKINNQNFSSVLCNGMNTDKGEVGCFGFNNK